MNRFTVIVTYSYDVPDDNLVSDYQTTDLAEAALIDEQNLVNMPYCIGEEINGGVDNLCVVVRAQKIDD